MGTRIWASLLAGCMAIAGVLVAVWPGSPDSAQVEPAPIQTVADSKPAGPDAIDFNRDIRPILSDRCFACHGPDAKVAKDAGGFRLDRFETATAKAESGERPIVPGDAQASQLVRRITSDNNKLVMPPPRSKLTISDEEIALLKRWIDEGAQYKGHWAYDRPMKRPAPEVVNEDWVRNDIDRFVARRMERAGLSPSAEADRATLIRRVYLDLIGLPPTPEEIDAFVRNDSPDAYEKLVDRLLANPHFGERMAIDWLDAARYADTIGYQLDHYRSAWPWRNWVIDAFNDNKPYNTFIIEQLAGDLLPNATDEQKLATAFCRMHMMNHEGGSIDEEFRVVAVADRIETIATVFMAQTYNCAMCHDHKYDPTTQDDYYALFKYFHSVEERGIWTNKPEHAIAYGPRVQWYSPEQKAELAKARDALKQAQQARQSAAPDIAKEQTAWEQALREKHGVRWAEAELTDAKTTQASGTIERKEDGSVLLSNRDSPGAEDLTLTYKTQATGLRLVKLDALTDTWNNDRVGRADTGAAQPTHLTIQATSLRDPKQSKAVQLQWAWASKSEQGKDRDALNILKQGRPGWGTGTDQDKDPRTLLLVADEPFGYEGGTELRVFIEHRSGESRRTLGRVRLGFAAAGASVMDAFPVVMRDWYEVGPFTGKFDDLYQQAFGPESPDTPLASGAKVDKLKWLAKPEINENTPYKLKGKNRATYFARTILTPVERQLKLKPGKTDGLRVYLNGEEVLADAEWSANAAEHKGLIITLKPGENRLVVKAINGPREGVFSLKSEAVGEAPGELDPLALIESPGRTEHGERTFSDRWRATRSPRYAALTRSVAGAEKAVAKATSQSTPVSIMKELAAPKDMFVLERGQYDKPIKDRPAELNLPSFIDLPMPEGAPNNRLGFAMWLTQPEHPLTARVQVNRVWKMLFGTGLVATVEDFGSQAEWPSHPELLDTLAVRFVESGWDQKALIKEIVMSATYRQRAVTKNETLEVDPENRLLSYFPRRRLAAELIRDQALAVSGLLVETIGGPSVKPYQPPGLWREVSMGPRSNTNIFKRDDGDKLYRRSLYTFIKRKSPPPQMASFGAPNRESCVVRRDMTNTPLQALVLWNDEQFLEAARVLAQRTLAEADDDDARIARIVRRCTGRQPGERELEVLRDALAYYRARYDEAPQAAAELLQQGEAPLPEQYEPGELASWMMVASSVLSLDETIVRD